MKVALVKADLKNSKQTEKIIPLAKKKLGTINCLVNNAALFEKDDIANFTNKSWNDHLNINLLAPTILTKQFAKQASKKTVSDIINIIDQRIFNLTPFFMSYTISKSGLETLTKTMAMRLGPNIKVNAIAPGPTIRSKRQTDKHFKNQVKSTLLKKLTNADAYAADELFATVDSLQRELKINNIQDPLIISDTVGFIQNLPTTLIESFKSTLLVATEADLLIHVVDAATAVPELHMNTVSKILEQIGTTANEILVFNKIDKIDKASYNELLDKYPNAIFISSLKNKGMPELIESIAEEIYCEILIDKYIVKPSNLEKISRYGKILNVQNESDYLVIELDIREKLANKLCSNKIIENYENA